MPVDNNVLNRWRSIPCETALGGLADHAKRDSSFEPTKDVQTSRWHASCAGRDFELLLTGTKFWDARACVGGGGAIDLVMHLRSCSFKDAVNYLRMSSL